MKDDCLFCKIINGEVPCHRIYENDKVLAFLDIGPVNKGHALVIPKEHHVNLLDMPDDILAEVAIASKKVANAVIEAVGADGCNIGKNNGAAAGQVIFHAHMHIIPRFKGDGLEHWPSGKYEEGEAEEIKEKIKEVI